MKITVKSVLIGLGAIAAIAGFAMMFLAPLTIGNIENPTLLKFLNSLGFNNGELPWQNFYFGYEEAEGYIIPAIGFILMGLGGILGLVLAFVSNKPGKRGVVLLLGILIGLMIIAGGVMALLPQELLIKDLASSGVDKVDELITNAIKETTSLGTGPLIGGILGIASALLIIVGSLLRGPKKATKKKRK